MPDSVLKRRIFFFGASATYHVHVSKGPQGRWRWSITNADGGTVCLSPVRGWGSEHDAREHVRAFFEALGIELQEVNA